MRDTIEDPVIRPIDHFAGARDAARPEDRLREVRKRAARLREELLDAPAVDCFRSRGLVRAPYPTRYGLRDAFRGPTPLLHILNRVFLVQFEAAGARRTLLVSPSDVEANAETPFFKRLAQSFGPFQDLGRRLVAPTLGTVEGCLAEAGLTPEDVDYITYDHLHTQDLRRWLGSHKKPGYFPRAKLLVMRQEWESTLALLPPQRDWYCPGGIDGVDPKRVVLLDGDVMLGRNVALLHTPGHTEGNHSIAVRTSEGIFVTSENGIAPECYAPRASRIPGVARYAADTGMEVVLNGNTLERGLDQYISMVEEKEVAGPSARNPDFPNMACSSELSAHWLFPGITPTFSLGDLTLGAPARPRMANGHQEIAASA
jgi:glyoxylase-like metal-dependent hydrolase (beta-lactamase superfamily II)